ncbi:MAG: sugar transferase [Candidatus Kapabacteria bacterium]|nr:sugar transferase [Candidatus Kapabacteria bacterium]
MNTELKNSVKFYLNFRYTVEKIIIVLILPLILGINFFVFIYISIYLKKRIIFRQKRPGKDCQPFTLLKFRTMDDEGNIPASLEFVRLHRFDEVPQFINILKGEMSLIGPRPEPWPYFKQIIEIFPEYRSRYRIKPGLTGLAQVEYQHTLTIEEAKMKYNYDMKYINSISLINDIKILFRTVSVLFTSKGAK